MLVILVGELDNATAILTRSSRVGTVEVANPPLSYFKVLAFDVEQDGQLALWPFREILLQKWKIKVCM